MRDIAQQRLRELRAACRGLLQDLPGADWQRQFHPDLSPLGWHLGHCFFVETYWLQEVVLANPGLTGPWHELYFPENAPKTGRARRLPAADDLLDWTREIEAANERAWADAAASAHTLLVGDYLPWFLIQHYAQHIETMQLALLQRALMRDTGRPPAGIAADNAAPDTVAIPAGSAHIGANGETAAYDNELPAQTREIAGFRLARHPVTNNQWLAFMQDDGYSDPRWWDAAGREWLAASGARQPQHWREHPEGGYFCPDPGQSMAGEAPVHGVCWYEARAYARWAGGRLPHEYEWEHAARLGLIENSGDVWEWCDNTLHPYPDFQAFPYSSYSTPWFDGGHRVLRGASRHTATEIRRPSFRNFYPPGHRHVQAGLRVAYGPAPGLVPDRG